MNVELHILQNFAPSNLNRDDTGSPKSCDFGGVRRARISSQAIKRAMRAEFKNQALVPEEQRAVRTKRILEDLTRRLVAAGHPEDEASLVVTSALESMGLKLDGQKTQYLLYLGEDELRAFQSFCENHWDALQALYAAGDKGKGTKKDAKKAAEDALPKGAIADLKKRLDGGRAADLALFGRMLADLPDNNIDAASQVAHAISTHQVNFDFDYYTAVDDLKPEDTAGADMIGTVEFNSACFYRYANIDLAQLTDNLGGDSELAATTVRAFLYASRDAIPTGKQNSFAARNAPSFAFAVVRDSGFWSLANAFVKPVRPRADEDIVQLSIGRLAQHWDDLTSMYGNPARTAVACGLKSLQIPTPLDNARRDTYEALVQQVMSAIEV